MKRISKNTKHTYSRSVCFYFAVKLENKSVWGTNWIIFQRVILCQLSTLNFPKSNFQIYFHYIINYPLLTSLRFLVDEMTSAFNCDHRYHDEWVQNEAYFFPSLKPWLILIGWRLFVNIKVYREFYWQILWLFWNFLINFMTISKRGFF